MRLAMMAVGMSLILAGSAVAQQAGVAAGRGVRGRTYGSPSGFGNVVFPGTGSAPPIPNPFYRHPTTFAQRLGATVSGFPGYQIGGRPYRGSRARAPIPYVVPVYVGGYYAALPPVQPAVTVVNPPQLSPPVIINQYYTVDTARPVVRDIAGLPEPASGGLRSYQAPVPSHPEPERAERRNPPEDGQPIESASGSSA